MKSNALLRAAGIVISSLLVFPIAAERLQNRQTPVPKLDSPVAVQLVSDELWFVQDQDALWKTSDGGRAWEEIYRPHPKSRAGFCCFRFLDGQAGFLAEDGRLLRTADGGATWKPLAEIASYVASFTFIDQTQGWAIGLADARDQDGRSVAFSTIDGGQSWKPIALPSLGSGPTALFSVFFYDSKNGWIAGDGILLRTRDGGKQWDIVGRDRLPYRRIFFATDKFGWVTLKDSGDFVLTEDGGTNWSYHTGPEVYGSWPSQVACITVLRCFVASLRLYATHDGDAGWMRIPEGQRDESDVISYVGVSPKGSLVALGASYVRGALILVSHNGGTWTQITPSGQSNMPRL